MTRKSTRKILRLAQKLACAAEMSLGPLLDLAPIRLGPLAESAARAAESIDGRRGVAIELAPSIASPSGRQDLVSADANWIEMLLIELVGNGLKHAHSKVVVALAQNADAVSISVTDDGRGPPPVTGPLFGPNQDLRGLGLSLAMGDRIARAHHGSLSIARTPSNGTEVTLSLPLLGRTQIVGGEVESPSVPPETLCVGRRDQATLNPRGRRPMGSTRR